MSKQATPSPRDSATERAREISRLLAKVQIRGYSAYKSLPQNYSDEIELGLLLNQRVNSSPATPLESDAPNQ